MNRWKHANHSIACDRYKLLCIQIISPVAWGWRCLGCDEFTFVRVQPEQLIFDVDLTWPSFLMLTGHFQQQ